MPAERRRRNILYPQSREEYSSWLKTNIDKSRIKVKYAKELGLDEPARFHSEQIKISKGRLAKVARSRPLGRVKAMQKPAYMFKLVQQSGI